ncbi:hypothetical protein [Kitasatospora sp. NPDC097643]
MSTTARLKESVRLPGVGDGTWLTYDDPSGTLNRWTRAVPGS